MVARVYRLSEGQVVILVSPISAVRGGYAVMGVKPIKIYPTFEEALAAIGRDNLSCSDGGCAPRPY